MNFDEYLKEKKPQIYNKICEYLPPKAPEQHYKMVREYVDRQGKYGRPTILMLWAEMHGANAIDALLPAAAMQCSEDWILVHDDLEDSNELRRGKPSAHMLYGERYAINAGDGLHVINWKIAFDAANKLNGERGKNFYNKFFDLLLVTTEGQYIDMHLTHDVNDITKFSLEDYFESISAKSGYYSVYGPMQLGAVIANQNGSILEKIKEYGIPVSRAFQIKDDILDCVSTADELGKTIGNDVLDGVKTSILWHFVKHASKEDLEKAKQIYSKERKDKTKQDVQFMFDCFKKYGSIAFAEGQTDDMAKESLEKFEKNSTYLKENEFKEMARQAITRMVKRKK